jgi:hypothetical protein
MQPRLGKLGEMYSLEKTNSCTFVFHLLNLHMHQHLLITYLNRVLLGTHAQPSNVNKGL